MRLGQACKKLSCRQSTDWIVPIPRNLYRRGQNKITFTKQGVRNGEIFRRICAPIPQHDIEIEHTRPPAHPHAAAAKTGLYRLQIPQHGLRIAPGAHQTGTVGITPVRGAYGRAFNDRGTGHNRSPITSQRVHRRGEHLARVAIARMPNIGAQRDEIELRAQTVRYPARFARKAAGGDHGKSPCPRGAWRHAPDRWWRSARRFPAHRIPQ